MTTSSPTPPLPATSPPSSRPSSRPSSGGVSPSQLEGIFGAHRAEKSKYLAQGFLFFVAIFFLIGTGIILRWSSQTIDQETALWQSRLGQGVEADAARVSDLFAAQLRPWQKLAQSTSFRLYVMSAVDTQPLEGASSDMTEARAARFAARSYIENALLLTAQREGIARDAGPPAAGGVGANVPIPSGPGLHLLALDGAPLFSTGLSIPQAPAHAPAYDLPDGGVRRGPYMSGDKLLITYRLPVAQVQAPDASAHLQVTYELTAAQVFKAPSRAQAGIQTETLLVHPRNDALLRAGGGPGGLDLLEFENFGGDQTLRWAALTANGYAAGQLPTGEKMLVAARVVDGGGWIAVQRVRADNALALVKRQTWVWLLGSLLALAASCFLILYAWRRGVEHRAAAISLARQTALGALERSNTFLQTLCDAQPTATLVVGPDKRLRYANSAARTLGLLGLQAGDDVTDGFWRDKSLSALVGADAARPLERAAETARALGQPICASVAIELMGTMRQGQVHARPIEDSPQGEGSSMLLVFDDLTDLIVMRERREDMLRQLVSVLAGLIDARDTHSAGHSRRVSALARQVGRALDFSIDDLRDLELAAVLSNAGKILVPREMLGRRDALSAQELEQVRAAVQQTSKLLDTVDFGGRTADILRQVISPAPQDADWQNRDVGPHVQQVAEIITLANRFVGMRSARAYRSALSLEKALDLLSEEKPDAAVFSALRHVIYNQPTQSA